MQILFQQRLLECQKRACETAGKERNGISLFTYRGEEGEIRFPFFPLHGLPPALSCCEYRVNEKLRPDLCPAPVNQPTEQSYDNEWVSNFFQSRLAATRYHQATGEKQELIVPM